MEKAFVIKFKNVENTAMYVRYFESGFIKSYHFDTAIEMGEHQENFIRVVFPFTIKDLAYFKLKRNKFEVQEIKPDLSFKRFWDEYAYKQGKKARAERLWKKLSPTERARALAYIAKYDNFLYQNKGISKAYPETYLSQKRWENED